MDFGFQLYMLCLLAIACLIPVMITGVVGVTTFVIDKKRSLNLPRQKVLLFLALIYIVLLTITCVLIDYYSRNIYAM